MPTLEHKKAKNLLLFDLYDGGHHPGYIQHLVRFWCTQKLPGKLNLVVPFNFNQKHPDITEIIDKSNTDNVQVIPVQKSEYYSLVDRKSPLHRAYRAIQEWKLLWRYVVLTKSDHCLLMFLDSFQTPISIGLRIPCSISGIYFLPIAHYKNFLGYKASLKDRFQCHRESLILPRVVNSPQFDNIFCLDPFAVSYIREMSTKSQTHYLPDPVKVYSHYSSEDLDELEKNLGVLPERKKLLLFGSLDKRKGILQVLLAVKSLSPEIAQKLSLLLVGPISEGCRSLVYSQVTDILKRIPVQIIIEDHFIQDDSIQPYFEVSDLILALYQRHVGMSAILVRAAAAQKPVLASNYGLMGEVVRRYRLGESVDSEDPKVIASEITSFINNDSRSLGDIEMMSNFAAENSADLFSLTIFKNILTLPN